MALTSANALDHVVLVLFENRSFDNLLGRLYQPGEVANFEGVLGKDLSNPIPDWAEHGQEHGVVTYEVATSMDAPDPDPGEEYQHTNTQLFNILDEANRFKDAMEMVAPYNAPAPGQVPTMDGFVTDYISFCTRELGRQPTYEEYRQIMTGYSPEQVPVLSGIAWGFGVFDHWFSEVPSQTFTNRSFWTSGASSNLIINRPMLHFIRDNLAETLFDRLDRLGISWKVYVLEPDPISFTGLLHKPRLQHNFKTHFVPFSEFERDAEAGTLPRFSLIEPNLLAGHGDYHPAFGRSLLPGADVPLDPPSSVLAGEAFLARVYAAYRAGCSESGSNVYNTSLIVGFDEPGGTYDHVPPGPAVPPDPAVTKGQLGFGFDRSGYRVPAVIVSPWVAAKSVFNEEYRHTSLLATLREVWGLGEPFGARDASARTFHHVFALERPRDPDSWPNPVAFPVPQFQMDRVAAGQAIGTLGKHVGQGILEHLTGSGSKFRIIPIKPTAEISPRLALAVIHFVARWYFPKLTGTRRYRWQVFRTMTADAVRARRGNGTT
jgi:phospholipase C